jgi:1,4-alpha-glucan branching enzyme
MSIFSADDLHLFNEGTHYRLWEKCGAHPTSDGTHFAVWAPNAESVSVIGDFNGWDPASAPLAPLGQSGIWQGSLAGVGKGAIYKYRVVS